jgi:hypothetical protein
MSQGRTGKPWGNKANNSRLVNNLATTTNKASSRHSTCQERPLGLLSRATLWRTPQGRAGLNAMVATDVVVLHGRSPWTFGEDDVGRTPLLRPCPSSANGSRWTVQGPINVDAPSLPALLGRHWAQPDDKNTFRETGGVSLSSYSLERATTASTSLTTISVCLDGTPGDPDGF